MSKIVVFGANGMLGTYVKKYFEDKYEVLSITREDLDLSIVNELNLSGLFVRQNITPGDVVINCAGTIKQRNPDVKEMIMVNSVFPLLLADECNKKGVQLIHITTDCVFNGEEHIESYNYYKETSVHNCIDDYGKSKSLGEPVNACVIRTSIIGEEKRNKLSLVEWVKNYNDYKIKGYGKHHWNGVTCLQLAKIIENVIQHKSYWTGVRHVFSNRVSKYELVKIINDVYELGKEVINYTQTEVCDRTLATIHNKVTSKDFIMPFLDEQILEMKNFKI